MSEPFLGEISMVGFNFAPRGWAYCDGQLLPIGQNQALFAILGTSFGGDGRTSFGLPDLRGRTPIGAGQGSGLSNRSVGAQVGSEPLVLTEAQIPSHTHTVKASSQDVNAPNPTGNILGKQPVEFYEDPSVEKPMHANSIASTGGGQGHENRQPYQAVRFIIALQGLFPSRN